MIPLLSIAAFAQDIDGWSPSGSLVFGRGSPTAESARVLDDERGFGILGAVAQDAGPADGPQAELLVPVVLAGGWAFGERVRIDAQMPLYAQVRADAAGWDGSAVGNVRLGAVIPLTSGETWGIAIVPRLGLPTGTAAAWVDRGTTGTLLLAANGEPDHIGWALQAGGTVAERAEIGPGVASGSTADGVAALWYRPVETFRIGAEISGQAGVSQAGRADAFAQVAHPSGLALAVTAGGGAGLSPGTRLSAAVTWRRMGASDADGDGIADDADQCRTEPEDADGARDDDGCPDPDDDGDGVADSADQCRAAAEDPDGREDGDGCPDLDDDADGVPDADDRCPTSAGPVSGGGCNDVDRDGLDDSADACPGKPAPKGEVGGDGCPKEAWITAKGIALAAPIQFEVSGGFLGASGDTAVAVALLLLAHPEIPLLEVAGHVHTGFGAEAVALSRVRAERVRKAIIAAGVAPERLVARGYGSERPIDTNRTTAGKGRNERIELVFPAPAPPAP